MEASVLLENIHDSVVTTHNQSIFIGHEAKRWNSLKESLRLNSDTELATILLDAYKKQSHFGVHENEIDQNSSSPALISSRMDHNVHEQSLVSMGANCIPDAAFISNGSLTSNGLTKSSEHISSKHQNRALEDFALRTFFEEPLPLSTINNVPKADILKAVIASLKEQTINIHTHHLLGIFIDYLNKALHPDNQDGSIVGRNELEETSSAYISGQGQCIVAQAASQCNIQAEDAYDDPDLTQTGHYDDAAALAHDPNANQITDQEKIKGEADLAHNNIVKHETDVVANNESDNNNTLDINTVTDESNDSKSNYLPWQEDEDSDYKPPCEQSIGKKTRKRSIDGNRKTFLLKAKKPKSVKEPVQTTSTQPRRRGRPKKTNSNLPTPSGTNESSVSVSNDQTELILGVAKSTSTTKRNRNSKRASDRAERRRKNNRYLPPRQENPWGTLSKSKRSVVYSDKNFPDITVKLEEHYDKFTITKHISMLKSERGLAPEQKNYDQLSCLVCRSYNTVDKAAMERHLRLHLQGRLDCEDCGRMFGNVELLGLHRRKEHMEKQLTCEHCAAHFFTKGGLLSHLAKQHDVKTNKCFECEESFSSRTAWKEHMFVAHEGIVIKCEHCGMLILNTDVAVCTHQMSDRCSPGGAEVNALTPCEICGKMMNKRSINKHKKTVHEKIKCYNCPHENCPFSTYGSTNLKKHLRIHSGEKNYHCEHCSFACAEKCQLTSHMKTHSGEKPFKCDMCPYAAAWNVQLKDHKKAHLSPSQIACQVCGVVLKDERTHNLHLKRVHQSLVV